MEVIAKSTGRLSVASRLITVPTDVMYKVAHGALRNSMILTPTNLAKSVVALDGSIIRVLTLGDALYEDMKAVFNLIDTNISTTTLRQLHDFIEDANTERRKGIISRCRVDMTNELKWLEVVSKFGNYPLPDWHLYVIKNNLTTGILDNKIREYKGGIDRDRAREAEAQERREAEARQQNAQVREPQPTIPVQRQGETGTMRKIRFMSRTNSLEGMTNVKNKLTELGLDTKRLKLTGSRFRPNSEHIVINWGNVEDIPSWYNDSSNDYRILNKQSAIKVAKNKKKTFDKLRTVVGLADMIPENTTDMAEANQWAHNGNKVFCRTLLESSSGNGITVASSQAQMVNAPLYVKGINIKHEYRVHVINNNTLIQRKAKLNSDAPHQDIRNHDNGYHFINEFSMTDSLKEFLQLVAKRAVQGLGLDFGSVDVVTTEEGHVKILEVNSASGISAPTVIEFYANNFKALARG